MIQPPNPTIWPDTEGGVVDNTCPKRYGVSKGPFTIQEGNFALDDGRYAHSSVFSGVQSETFVSASGDNPFMFARLSAFSFRHFLIQFTDEVDPVRGRKYLFWWPVNHPWNEAIHTSGWNTTTTGTLWIKDACRQQGVRWKDIDGDGAGKSKKTRQVDGY